MTLSFQNAIYVVLRSKTLVHQTHTFWCRSSTLKYLMWQLLHVLMPQANGFSNFTEYKWLLRIINWTRAIISHHMSILFFYLFKTLWLNNFIFYLLLLNYSPSKEIYFDAVYKDLRQYTLLQIWQDLSWMKRKDFRHLTTSSSPVKKKKSEPSCEITIAK